jgi:hypothetical protein
MTEEPPLFLQPGRNGRGRYSQATRGVDELGKRLPQAGQRPVDADAGVGGGNTKDIGDLAVAEITYVAQFQDTAMTVIELLEGLAYKADELAGSHLLLGCRRKVPGLRAYPRCDVRVGIDQFPDRLQVAQAVPDQAPDDGAQVGLQGMLALPLAQDAKIVAPEMQIDVVSEIIDEQGRCRRCGPAAPFGRCLGSG